jgi:predicted exporter
MTARWITIAIWLAGLAVAALVVARIHVDTDMAAFLPRDPSPAQRVLVDQLRDGVVSRLVLVAVTGAPTDRLVELDRRLAARLRADDLFASVDNGEESALEKDRAFLWSNRYLLSDQIDAAHFSTASLHAALERDLDALGSSGGMFLKQTLGADPTGEMLHLVEQMVGGGSGPARRDGVWVSPDGGRALLLARLRTAGSDIDGAERALAAIRSGFSAVSTDGADAAARLLMTGPPVFSVEARDRIKSDATRLSTLASLLVAGTLLAAYRSPRMLLLAFVPVASGALAGVAAVGLVFRTVHGITLGFGATLIGEAVDYAVYLFTQTAPDAPIGQTLARIWPTLRLGVLTSICGFSAMLLSRFDGFAQLGLFTITGLAVAVGVTRFVLPALVPGRFVGLRQSRGMMAAAALATRARWLTPGVASIVILAGGSLALGRGDFWAGDLASLSPLPPASQRLDQSLRDDMRAPDAAFMVVVRAAEQETALAASERIATALAKLEPGALAGFDAPGRYLPSQATQRARRAALPDAADLRSSLDAALGDMPFRADLFTPFLAAVAAERQRPLIDRADLDGTALAIRLDSLLLHRADGWVATLPLRGVVAPAAIASAIEREDGATLVDLKTESNGLLRTYLREGVSLAALGSVGIVLLLLAGMRSLRRLASALAPLAAAVIVTLAALRLGGHALSVFNLFGLLLVVAIGSNYCLFFDRHRHDPAGLPRVLASLMLANICTVAGFGVLAFSQTPVLHDLGLPVAIGTFLSLAFATITMSPIRDRARAHAV